MIGEATRRPPPPFELIEWLRAPTSPTLPAGRTSGLMASRRPVCVGLPQRIGRGA